MGRPINASLHQSWRARIEQQSASGLTVAAFCRQRGIAGNSFYAWRRRLADEPLQDTVPRRSASHSPSLVPAAGIATQDGSGKFIRIPLEPGAYSSCLEVVLTDQTRLRVPSQHLVAWELTLQTIMNRVLGQEPSEVHHV